MKMRLKLKCGSKSLVLEANGFISIALIEENSPAELFEKLTERRRELAAAKGIRPGGIFSDDTLRELAEKRPQSLRSFLGITGIGFAKVDKYGQPFLDVILAS